LSAALLQDVVAVGGDNGLIVGVNYISRAQRVRLQGDYSILQGRQIRPDGLQSDKFPGLQLFG
jgi:hypothetical protein